MNPSLVPQQKGVVNVAAARIIGNTQMPLMQVPAPPGYHASGKDVCVLFQNRNNNFLFLESNFYQQHVNRSSPHWTMPPPAQQPRPYLQQQNQQVTTTQGSALIAQLTQPPSSISGTAVNQFGQSNFTYSTC